MTTNRLTELGLKYGTDKATYHGFTEFYDKLLQGRDISTLLEIGIYKGASLQMWRDYFPDTVIIGFDISEVKVPGCLTFKVNCEDSMEIFKTISVKLLPVYFSIGNEFFDLIIDDGGHTMKQQQVTFNALWPRLASGGIYIIEDIHTSRMPEYNTEEDDITTEGWIKNNFLGSRYHENSSTQFQVFNIIWWARHPSIENDSRTVAIIKK